MADALQVELVAADRTVWSGEATMVIARTVEGDIGILRGHAPVLSLLTDAVVEIDAGDGEVVIAAVDGGFISVANDRVSILSEHACSPPTSTSSAERSELEAAQADEGDDAEARIRRAEARIRAAERACVTRRHDEEGRCRCGSGCSTQPACCSCSPCSTAACLVAPAPAAVPARRHLRAQPPVGVRRARQRLGPRAGPLLR